MGSDRSGERGSAMNEPQPPWPRQGPPPPGQPPGGPGSVPPGYQAPPGYQDGPGYQGVPGYQGGPGYPGGPGYQGVPGYQGGPGHPGWSGGDGTPGYAAPPGYQAPPGQPPYAPNGGYQAPPAGYANHYQPPPGYQPGSGPSQKQEPDIADWWQRLVARIVDGFVFTIVYWILSGIFNALFRPSLEFDSTGVHWTGNVILPALLSSVIAGLLYAGYDAYMHIKFGATAGKMLLKLKLARVDRQPPSQAEILKRAIAYPGVFALVGVVGAMGLFVLGLGSMLLAAVSLADGIFLLIDDVRRQSLHDRFAGTVVLKTDATPTLG
jgi:uncharacterized RDD family membrane protein YckC